MTSPLSSTDPEALSTLFSVDPLTLSDEQVLLAITELRRRRNVFAAEEAAKSLAPKKTRAKATPQPADVAAELNKPTAELSLDDLL